MLALSERYDEYYCFLQITDVRVYLFVFSSRRRHTRLVSDWSSDVCSSDLTRDPDSGVQNMGIYRGQVKAPRRLGMNPSLELRPGIYTHWEKMKKRRQKLPAAVVLGAPPCIAFASAQKVPETLDELHVAGALVGMPINVVKAKTVDLLVPAEAEIVVE